MNQLVSLGLKKCIHPIVIFVSPRASSAHVKRKPIASLKGHGTSNTTSCARFWLCRKSETERLNREILSGLTSDIRAKISFNVRGRCVDRWSTLCFAPMTNVASKSASFTWGLRENRAYSRASNTAAVGHNSDGMITPVPDARLIWRQETPGPGLESTPDVTVN